MFVVVLSSRQPFSFCLKFRDFVPGYSRFTRYCLPDRLNY